MLISPSTSSCSDFYQQCEYIRSSNDAYMEVVVISCRLFTQGMVPWLEFHMLSYIKNDVACHLDTDKHIFELVKLLYLITYLSVTILWSCYQSQCP